MVRRTAAEAPEYREGVITALVARSGQDERLAVHLDGRRAFDLSAVVVHQGGLRVGDRLPAERQRELAALDAPYRAHDRAMRLLALRERSRRELDTRLRQAGFDAAVVTETLDWLVGLGYLDDGRFAVAYAREKERAGWGPRRIRAELAAKGVERRVVDETLAGLEAVQRGPEDDVEGAEGGHALEQTVRRRFGAQFASDPEAAERRLSGFMARRGYDWESINRMVRKLRSEASRDSEFPSIP